MKLIAFLLLIPAIAAYTCGQLAIHGKLRWARNNSDFWGNKSYLRKYKLVQHRNQEPLVPIDPSQTWYYRFFKIKYKERFPLSATLLVNLTDGYHMCQSIMFLCLAGSFSIASSLNFLLVWGGLLLVHFVTYRALQK